MFVPTYHPQRSKKSETTKSTWRVPGHTSTTLGDTLNKRKCTGYSQHSWMDPTCPPHCIEAAEGLNEVWNRCMKIRLVLWSGDDNSKRSYHGMVHVEMDESMWILAPRWNRLNGVPYLLHGQALATTGWASMHAQWKFVWKDPLPRNATTKHFCDYRSWLQVLGREFGSSKLLAHNVQKPWL